MIKYRSRGCCACNVFKLKGSVFPYAAKMAFPVSVISSVLTYLMILEIPFTNDLSDKASIIKEPSIFGGFSTLVGFLIVFRTSQAYNRFWDGCTATHLMRAEWFDACSALCAFTKYSKEPRSKIDIFTQTLIRLFSILHAVALAEIEDSNSDEPDAIAAFRFDLIDAGSLDPESLAFLKDCHAKTELVFQWIQNLVVENIETGVLSIPAPILSRAFQEIANGMVAAHEAIKISSIPFPFPYAQTCEALLWMHWFISPVLISQWVVSPFVGFVFCFIQVFILWSLNQIAVEIENPFGDDDNDIDGEAMQLEMNQHLLLLVMAETNRTPKLTFDGSLLATQDSHEHSHTTAQILNISGSAQRRTSLLEVWSGFNRENLEELGVENYQRQNSPNSPRSGDRSHNSSPTHDAELGSRHKMFGRTESGGGRISQCSAFSADSGFSCRFSHDGDATHPAAGHGHDGTFATYEVKMGQASIDLAIGRSNRRGSNQKKLKAESAEAAERSHHPTNQTLTSHNVLEHSNDLRSLHELLGNTDPADNTPRDSDVPVRSVSEETGDPRQDIPQEMPHMNGEKVSEAAPDLGIGAGSTGGLGEICSGAIARRQPPVTPESKLHLPLPKG